MIDPVDSSQDKSNREQQSPSSDSHELPVSRSEKTANAAARPETHSAAVQTNPALRPAPSDLQKGKPSSLRRALGAARTVLPAILPLLEGNVAAAATNLLTSRGKDADLSKIDNALARLRSEQGINRSDLSDYKVALKNLEDQFRMIKEASHQYAQEQQKLAAELDSLRKRSAVITWVVLLLLAISLSANLFLLLHFHTGRP